jgi:hypothetical protein
MVTNQSLTEFLDKAAETKPVKEVIQMSPAVLQGVSESDAQLLYKAFGIKTVEDFATNKFVLMAQALVTVARFEKL